MNYEIAPDVNFAAGARAGAQAAASKRLSTHYRVECFDRAGNLKWADEFDNTVVTAGLNDSLDKHLKGDTYTAAWYVGLTDGTPSFAAGDTMDGAHAGWTEVEAYDEANRPALTLGSVAAGSVDNSASKAEFTISTNSTTIGGAFVVSDNTIGGTSGVLYGGGAFTAGDKVLDAGDTLFVTVTLTAAAA